MKQLIINDKGFIIDSNDTTFKESNSIFDLGFDINSLTIILNSDEIILINFFEKNYIVKNLKVNFNMGLVCLIFEEYKNNYINVENKKVNYDLYYINNYDSVEQYAMFAIRNGYIQDKEIINFLKDLGGMNQDFYKIQYAMKKLFSKFGVLARSELLRNIYFYKLDTFFPKDLFKPGLYNTHFKQLQIF